MGVVEEDTRLLLDGGAPSNEDESEVAPEEGEKETGEKRRWPDWKTAGSAAGYSLTFVSALTISASGGIVKLLSSVDPFMLVAIRGLCGCLVTLPYLSHQGIAPAPEGKVFLLALSGVCNMMAMAGFYVGLKQLPMGPVSTLFATQVVFVSVLGHCLLGEPCGWADLPSWIFIVVGTALVTNMPLEHACSQDDSCSSDLTYYLASAVVLAGSMFQGLGYVVARHLRDVDSGLIGFWIGLACLPLFFVVNYATGTLVMPSPRDSLLAVALSLLSYVSDLTIILALKFVSAGKGTVMRRTLTILMSYGLQVLWHREAPRVASLAGSSLIIVTVVYEGLRKE